MTAGAANEVRRQFIAELHGHGAARSNLAGFIARLEAAECLAPTQSSPASVPSTAAPVLARTLDRLECSKALAGAVRSMAGATHWYRILDGDGIEPKLAEGLVVGRIDLADPAAARFGFFLLTPDLHYPLHQHAALEIYYVVSGALTLQHGRDGTPFRIDAGEFSVTPSNRVHALTTGAEPCLLVYCWTGQVGSPSWWWEQTGDGDWHRVCWQRLPDGRWKKQSREPVTEATLREAGEI